MPGMPARLRGQAMVMGDLGSAKAYCDNFGKYWCVEGGAGTNTKLTTLGPIGTNSLTPLSPLIVLLL